MGPSGGGENDSDSTNPATYVAKDGWLDTRKSEMRNNLNEYLLGNVLHTTVILSCACIVYSVYLNCPVL
jgi:hypothetical protein